MTLEEFKQRYQYDPETDRLGTGGFAKVYKAYDTLMKRPVALKFYYGDMGEKYGVLAELKKVINFKHPNLVRYYDATLLDIESAYDDRKKVQVGIMEYANGGDLNDFMKTFPNLIELKTVIRGMLEGLAYLHNKGVIHRDIKPQNILLHKDENEGWVTKIADFGLAKKIDQGMVSSKILGTMEYMAPEQFDTKRYGINNQLHTNVDLWAAGIILFEMFTGELPFGSRDEGVSHEQMMFSIMREEVRSSINEVMPPYKTMIEWCLVKKADERVLTAEELIAVLDGKEEVVQQLKQKRELPKDKRYERLTKGQKRMIFAGNVVLSPLLGVILYFVWQKQQPKKANEAFSLAWWSLAAWLMVLILIIGFMMMSEYNLLQK